MKFILSIFALLTIVFIVGCSAKDSNDKLSSSEIRKLGKKYGGVYVFNKEFEKEIEKREAERKEARKELKGRDLGSGLYAVDNKPVDKKFPQTLSNGKKYYTRTRDYEQDYKKAVSLSKKYIDRIINFIGQQDYNKFKPSIDIGYFYVDNDEVIPIDLSVTYSYQGTKYGLFGDEGRGFSLSRDEIYTVRGGNKFYLEDLEDEEIKNK